MLRSDDHDQEPKVASTPTTTEVAVMLHVAEVDHHSEVVARVQASTEKLQALTVVTSRLLEVASQPHQPGAEVRHKQHRSLCDSSDDRSSKSAELLQS